MGTNNKEDVSIAKNTTFWHLKSQKEPSWGLTNILAEHSKIVKLGEEGRAHLAKAGPAWSEAEAGLVSQMAANSRPSQLAAVAFSATVYGGPARKYTLDKNLLFHEDSQMQMSIYFEYF